MLLRAGGAGVERGYAGLSSLLRAKREPEKHQRFRRAGSTRKGLLAPFRPQRSSRSTKMLAASLNAFFVLLRFTAPPMVLRFSRTSRSARA